MRITRVFLNTDMRQSFLGLRALAEKESAALNAASTIVFMNTARTKFKVLVANQYLIYYDNGGKIVPLDSLMYLPSMFAGTKAEMNDAIRKTLEEKMRRR